MKKWHSLESPQIYLQMQDEKLFQIRVHLMECVLCSLPGTMT